MLPRSESRVASLGLTFRLARSDESDRQHFCDLSNSLYARKVSPAYYDWQFFQTPHPCLLSFALTETGELAGCYGFHLFDAGPNARLGMALDIMVAPPFQGKGVFRILADFATRQISPYKPVAIYVMANQRAEGAHIHGLGWERINVLVNHVCNTEIAERLKSQRIKFVKVDDLGAYQTDLSELLRIQMKRKLLTIGRSTEFLIWRFLQNQRYRYDFYRCMLGGRLFGYLVLKTFRDPHAGELFGDIVDLLWAKDDPNLLTEMLMFALNHFYRQGIARSTTWLQTGTLFDQLGRRIGFEPTQRRRYLCGKALDTTYRWLMDPARWFITMVDSEVY